MVWMNFVKELLMAAEMSNVEALGLHTLAEVKCHPDWPLWEKAINKELETLCKAGTWELTHQGIRDGLVFPGGVDKLINV